MRVLTQLRASDSLSVHIPYHIAIVPVLPFHPVVSYILSSILGLLVLQYRDTLLPLRSSVESGVSSLVTINSKSIKNKNKNNQRTREPKP